MKILVFQTAELEFIVLTEPINFLISRVKPYRLSEVKLFSKDHTVRFFGFGGVGVSSRSYYVAQNWPQFPEVILPGHPALGLQA